jgi:hypothetical protein
LSEKQRSFADLKLEVLGLFAIPALLREDPMSNINGKVYALNISEISGDKQKSMDEYRALQEELKNQESTLRDSVDEAIARLSRR